MTTATIIPIRRQFQVHRFDPIKHGVLSKHIALPWEDRAEFEDILRGLLVEHSPQGPTAYHLVEDLAGVIWRKRRLLQAEGAAIRERFYKVTQDYGHEKVGKYALAHEAGRIKASITDIIADRFPEPADMHRELAAIKTVEAILEAGQRGAYTKALAAMSDSLRQSFDDEAIDLTAPDNGGYTRDPDGLSEFLSDTRRWYETRLTDSASAPMVKDQAQGMAIDMRDLEAIAKVEAHLDRKLQGLLAELRRLPKPAQAKI